MIVAKILKKNISPVLLKENMTFLVQAVVINQDVVDTHKEYKTLIYLFKVWS